MRLTRLHLILILVVLGAIGLFIAQNKKRVPTNKISQAPDVTITEIQPNKPRTNQPNTIIPAAPAQPAEVLSEKVNTEKTAREAIAVGGEYMLITQKADRDALKGQSILRESKNEYASGNYETAILMAKQAISEFKSAPKMAARRKTGVYYRVVSKDCLWKIAAMKKHYGKGWLWPKIWKANRKKIKIPQLIYPKQKLFIPDVRRKHAG